MEAMTTAEPVGATDMSTVSNAQPASILQMIDLYLTSLTIRNGNIAEARQRFERAVTKSAKRRALVDLRRHSLLLIQTAQTVRVGVSGLRVEEGL